MVYPIKSTTDIQRVNYIYIYIWMQAIPHNIVVIDKHHMSPLVPVKKVTMIIFFPPCLSRPAITLQKIQWREGTFSTSLKFFWICKSYRGHVVPHSHSVHIKHHCILLDLNYSSTRHLKDTQFHWKKRHTSYVDHIRMFPAQIFFFFKWKKRVKSK